MADPAAIGAHTFGFVWQDDAAGAIRRLAASGLRRFQLMAMAPHLDPCADNAAQIADIRATVASHGAEILAIDLASSECNLASTSPGIADAAVALYRRVLELGAAAGARALTINSGRSHALLPPPDDRLERAFRRSLDALIVAARARGMRILIENIPGMVLARAETLRGFLDRGGYQDVGVLYDVTNALAIGEDPVEGMSILAPHLRLLHLSDAPRGVWRHVPVGTGDVDFRAILRQAKAIGYRGPIVIEVIGADPLADLLASRARIAAIGAEVGFWDGSP
ncbi:MAG: sugar phosphate isomerase/epimerase [Rhodospirillales bacterium]|nr:sugar phosphate isomerase/epimerase [Rhodospirillales bacterium]